MLSAKELTQRWSRSTLIRVVVLLAILIGGMSLASPLPAPAANYTRAPPSGLDGGFGRGPTGKGPFGQYFTYDTCSEIEQRHEILRFSPAGPITLVRGGSCSGGQPTLYRCTREGNVTARVWAREKDGFVWVSRYDNDFVVFQCKDGDPIDILANLWDRMPKEHRVVITGMWAAFICGDPGSPQNGRQLARQIACDSFTERFRRMAFDADPPDFNYKTLASVQIQPYPPITDDDLAESSRMAIEEWRAASAIWGAVTRAWVTTYERQQGAFLSRDQQWVDRHNDALNSLAVELSEASSRLASAYSGLEGKLDDIDFADGLDRQQAVAALRDLRLGESYETLLRNLEPYELTDRELQLLRGAIWNLRVEDVVGFSLRDWLTDTDRVEELNDLIDWLKTAATIEAPVVDTGRAPDTRITSGPSGSISTRSTSFGFTSSESGSTFQCKLGRGSWSKCTSPKSYTGLSNGSRTFHVRAADKAGHTDASPATRSFTVNVASPPPATARIAVRVTAVKKRSKIKVDVNPNQSSFNYKIRVQKKVNGKWQHKKTTRTKGRKDKRTINMPKGRYRIKVPKQHGLKGAKSKTVRLKR